MHGGSAALVTIPNLTPCVYSVNRGGLGTFPRRSIEKRVSERNKNKQSQQYSESTIKRDLIHL